MNEQPHDQEQIEQTEQPTPEPVELQPEEPEAEQPQTIYTQEVNDTKDEPDTQSSEPDESEPQAKTDEPEQPQLVEIQEDTEINPDLVVEAVLFATDEPIPPAKLVEIVGTGDVREMRKIIETLNEKYEQMGTAFRVEEIAGGYQMLTLPIFNNWLKKLVKVRAESKLSPAALETLAIIAYKQPILRVDVEAIRGVAAGEMIRQLSEKGLVKIVGRAEELGRPLLYGTTKKFLQVFGLASLKDLPTAKDLQKPE